MAAIETIPPWIVRHRVDPFILQWAAVCSHSARLRNLCGVRLVNRLDIGPTTALELDVQDVRFGSKAACAVQNGMSALPPKADIVCDKVRIMKPVTIASVRAHGVRQLLVYCNGKREGDWPGSADRAGSGLGSFPPSRDPAHTVPPAE